MPDEHDHTLSHAFMRAHPAQAARVLEAVAPEEATPVFERSPARVSAGVLAAMLPRWAARCLGALDDERALELLAAMPTQAAVTVLRHLPDIRRRLLVARLPTATALASTLLLGYREELVGAWADPDLVALEAEVRVETALTRMRGSGTAYPELIITDASGRIVGIVGLASLVRAPENATLGTLMNPPVAVLDSQMSLQSAIEHPGWEHASLLPVADHGARLVGLLSRDALARALRRTTPEAPVPDSAAGLPVVFARTYWQALSGLLECGLGLLPKLPASRRSDHDD